MKPGCRPSFLGHLLTEVLLDWVLIEEGPGRSRRVLPSAGADGCVPAPGDRQPDVPSTHATSGGHDRGISGRGILSDYREDARLLGRLNQVMRRVNLPPLPDHFSGILPEARWRVAGRAGEMLA